MGITEFATEPVPEGYVTLSGDKYYDPQPIQADEDMSGFASARRVTGQAVRMALAEAAPRAQVIQIDSKYWVLNEADWDEVLAAHPPRNKYTPERYDCDDFAIHFKGWVSYTYKINTVGWVLDFSGEHSYDVVIVGEEDGSLKARFVEPQSDRMVKLGSNHHILTSGIIII